MTFDLYLAD